MLEVVFHPRASKELREIPKKQRLRILNAIEELKNVSHPLHHHGVIKLHGSGKRQDFRLRVGDYRVKFSLRSPHSLLVTHVQHRQAGY